MRRKTIVRSLNHAGLILLTVCQLHTAHASAATGCQLIKLGTLHIDDSPSGPVTMGKLNGHDIAVLVDTGSFATTIVTSAAERAGLHPVPAPNAYFYGVDGKIQAEAVNVKRLQFGTFVIKNRVLLAAPQPDKRDVGLVLGADVLSNVDVEIDLSKHSMILWQPRHCDHTTLSYWNQNPMTVRLERHTGTNPFGLDVKIDGKHFEAILDTGTDHSLMGADVARILGFDYRKAKVHDFVRGIAGRDLPVYLARFDTFSLGPMTIKNARFLVSDVHKATAAVNIGSKIPKGRRDIPSIFIGTDFLRANHVYIANSQKLLYFTYEGGPVFQRGP